MYSSSAVTVDGTPPVFSGALLDTLALGAVVDVDFSNAPSTVCVAFSVDDSVSGIVKIDATLMMPSTGAIVLAIVVPATSRSACFPTTVALVSGTRYATRVTATNGCGLSSSATSSGFLFDNVPPVPPVVADGNPSVCGAGDVDVQPYAYFACSWAPLVDPGSGVKSVAVQFFVCGFPDTVLGEAKSLPPDATSAIIATGFGAVSSQVCFIGCSTGCLFALDCVSVLSPWVV